MFKQLFRQWLGIKPKNREEEPKKEMFNECWSKEEVPNEKWYKSNKFLRTKGNAGIVPSWYKCKHCGREFQTSPPSYHALGDMDSLHDECPDCEVGTKVKVVKRITGMTPLEKANNWIKQYATNQKD